MRFRLWSIVEWFLLEVSHSIYSRIFRLLDTIVWQIVVIKLNLNLFRFPLKWCNVIKSIVSVFPRDEHIGLNWLHLCFLRTSLLHTFYTGSLLHINCTFALQYTKVNVFMRRSKRFSNLQLSWNTSIIHFPFYCRMFVIKGPSWVYCTAFFII